MIELLVVISIIALLMAILLPALARVRDQARAVACQGKLRQWGLIFSTYVSTSDGRYPLADICRTGSWYRLLRPYCSDSNDMVLCPMATRYEVNKNDPYWWDSPNGSRGSKFTTWKAPYAAVAGQASGYFYGSYGINVRLALLHAYPSNYRVLQRTWKGEDHPQTPLLLDCAYSGVLPRPEEDTPPPYDGSLEDRWNMSLLCIDRHQGTINGLFWDTTVRKIGLKELWTLKWYPGCNTANAWTKAGGVRPENWPEWMRKFKDY